MLDCSRRNQGVRQPDRPVNASSPAIGYEPGPADHHRLTYRYRLGHSGQRERVGAPRPGRRILCRKHAKLELADRHDRYCRPVRERPERTAGLARDEH